MAIVVTENKFIDKLKDLSKIGSKKSMTDSLNWFRNKVKEVKGKAFPAARKLRRELEDEGRLRAVPDLGKMYFYNYNPKYKEKLPYYDIFPLIFPFKYETKPNKGWWGINLHYLYLNDRAILMDVLKSLDKNGTLGLTEKTVKSLIKSQKRIIPCIKRYVYSGLDGGFIEIAQKEWDYAFLLPVQKFKKQKEAQVWKQSKDYY
tara:strand:- start:512 stop:1120 length:609 start_codon:yes stop_codon:yes gene_type:complete